MTPYTADLHEIDGTMIGLVGGKGANLGVLAAHAGITVPEGFCVTTAAYRKATERNDRFAQLLDRIGELNAHEKDSISETSGAIRSVLEQIELDDEISREITEALSRYGEDQAFAIRSSATAEDLPDASFAGQQDTFLNIRGTDAVLTHVLKCWASLFSDRAVTYRIRNRFDHRTVLLSVVIQKMVPAEVSGILFTADPVSSDRKTLVINAGRGLGEALVSGIATPDTYKIRNGTIVLKRTGAQAREVRLAPGGGTVETATEVRTGQALSDDEIFRLAELGRTIETVFGFPQDIEWCLSEGEFSVVQSRPITTLFPAPESPDGVKRVYMSSGHMQVMTDPILPLGMSMFELASFFPLDKAGGRLFVDITFDLTTPMGRRMVKQKVDNMDPLMASAVRKVLADTGYIKTLPKGKGNLLKNASVLPWLREAMRIYRKNDPSIIDTMILRNEAELERLENDLRGRSGDAVFEFILNDRTALKEALFDAVIFGAVLASQFASGRLSGNAEKLLGEKNLTFALSRSVEHNVTSEMGLSLAGVADIVRRYPEVREYLRNAEDERFFEGLSGLPGGAETAEAIRVFLRKYGMRCPAEIDITRPRFGEKPTQLVPLILSDVELLKPGEHREVFEQGKREALKLAQEIVSRLREINGARAARKVEKAIGVFRNFVGVREYAKYYWMRRLAIYKRALVLEAENLAGAGVLHEAEDAYYLYFDEFRAAVKTGRADLSVIGKRKAEYAGFETLTPPRIILSDGEVPPGEYGERGIPEGALAGVPVSPGVVEGRARVVESLSEADLEEGDILVTVFTDPSWTPVFLSIAGLVTEVGGEMSHGAVITREYGLPAVVGVENATKLIRDGRRIRLNAAEGYVELL